MDVHSVASFFVSRVDSEVDKRLEEAGPHRPAGHRGRGQRAGRLRALPGDLPRRALRRAARGRGAGAAPAVGLDRRQEPALLGHACTWTSWSLPTPSTRCRCPRCWPPPSQGEVRGATADQDPSEQLDALADAGIDMDDVTDKLLDDGIELFKTPMEELIAGVEERARAWSPGARRPSSRCSPTSSRSRSPTPASGRWTTARPSASGPRTTTLWGEEGAPEVADRLGWLTISESMLEERGRPARLRGRLPGRRADRRRAAGYGRLVAGPGGDPPHVRGDRRRDAPARPGLHRSRRGAGAGAPARPGQDAVRRVVQVGRDDRDAVALPPLPRPRA